MELASKLFQLQPEKQILELRTVLEKSLSSDELEAETAQVVLLQFSQSNFQEYLLKLSFILHGKRNNSKTRKAAAIHLRNSFIAREGIAQQIEYNQKWFSIPDDVRQHVKNNVLKSLGTESVIPSPAASCLVAIAAVEFPIEGWPELLNILMDIITNKVNVDHKREAALDAIKFLCHEIIANDGRQVLIRNSNRILKSILTGMKDVNNQIILAATKALSHSTELFADNFNDTIQCKFVMQTVCETAQSSDVEIKVAALTCIICIITRYYEFMDEFMEEKLFPIAVEAMKSDVKQVRVKGIEFCRELCYLEEDLEKTNHMIKNKDDYQHLATPPRYDRCYMKNNLEILMPIFMEMLINNVKSNDHGIGKLSDRDDETWDILTYFLETLVNSFEDSSVRQYISIFVAKHIKNSDWRYRNAAVTALSFILKSERENLRNLLPRLMDIILYDKNYEVRASTAQTIAEACASLQDGDSNLKLLVQSLLYELNDGPKVAIGICDAFARLAFAGKENITEHFEIIVPKLLQTICRADGNNRLRWDASIAIGYVVGQSPMKCYFTVHKAVAIIMNCLQDPSNPCHSSEALATLCVTVQTVLKRLPKEEACQMCNMVVCCLLEICPKLNQPLNKSILRLISTLVKGQYAADTSTLCPLLGFDY